MSCVVMKATRKNGIYVRENPARAGFANSAEDWPHQGEIVYIDRT